jgi:hypothetical protein
VASQGRRAVALSPPPAPPQNTSRPLAGSPRRQHPAPRAPQVVTRSSRCKQRLLWPSWGAAAARPEPSAP